jgi:gamma-glutamyltranspeptidase/glutathione hydrolase
MLLLNRENRRHSPEIWSQTSDKGMVSSAHYKATEAGAFILGMGGNAMDAAIAVSMALGVVEPNGSGLGGMTMMMVYQSTTKETFMIEGPCRAPLNATPEVVARSERKSGYRAVAVPSNPQVLGFVHEKYGSLSIDKILAPALNLAEKGVVITPLQSKIRKDYLKGILKGNAAGFILSENLLPPEPGSLFRNPTLADTIGHIAQNGFSSFYSGDIGRAIISDMEKNRGFISEGDLAAIPLPSVSKPLTGKFHSWDIYGAPPPCGGMALIEMLNLFEELEPEDFDPDSPEAAVLFASIIRKARRDRRKHRLIPLDLSLWDGPDLTSKTYARLAAKKMRPGLVESRIKMIEEGAGETTHFNVMDAWGNVVAVTQSIERSFGAKVAAPDLGFLYNGFMKGFKIENKKHPHYLKPGAIARSNASPTIIMENGLPRFAIGSTGSERMISGIFQVLIRIYKGQTPFEAVKAQRLHCNPEGQVWLEKQRFSEKAVQRLSEKGYEVISYDSEWSFSSGGLHMLSIENGEATGVADPRRDGSASGPLS